MKTQKVTLHISAQKYTWDNEFKITIDMYKCKSDDTCVVVQLDTQEVEIPVPEIDEKALTLVQIEHLKTSIEKEKTDSYKRILGIEDAISKLQCIENTIPVQPVSTGIDADFNGPVIDFDDDIVFEGS